MYLHVRQWGVVYTHMCRLDKLSAIRDALVNSHHYLWTPHLWDMKTLLQDFDSHILTNTSYMDIRDPQRMHPAVAIPLTFSLVQPWGSQLMLLNYLDDYWLTAMWFGPDVLAGAVPQELLMTGRDTEERPGSVGIEWTECFSSTYVSLASHI